MHASKDSLGQCFMGKKKWGFFGYNEIIIPNACKRLFDTFKDLFSSLKK